MRHLCTKLLHNKQQLLHMKLWMCGSSVQLNADGETKPPPELCFKFSQQSKSKVTASQQQQQRQQQEVFLPSDSWTCSVTGACRGGWTSLAKLQWPCLIRQDEQWALIKEELFQLGHLAFIAPRAAVTLDKKGRAEDHFNQYSVHFWNFSCSPKRLRLYELQWSKNRAWSSGEHREDGNIPQTCCVPEGKPEACYCLPQGTIINLLLHNGCRMVCCILIVCVFRTHEKCNHFTCLITRK